MHKQVKSLLVLSVAAMLLTACGAGGTTSESTTSSSSTSTSTSTSTTTPVPGDYYEKATGTGLTLFNNLRGIINTGYKSVGYSGLWNAYKTTDIKTDGSGEIADCYSNITHWKTDGKGQCGSYSEEGDCFNREHSIPQSWWGGGTSNQGSDVFIVIPSDGKINGDRGNYPFGLVGSSYKASKNNYSKWGKANSSSGYSGTVFEPNDEWKGDFARIYFYALTKWSGSENWRTSEGSYVFSGSLNTHVGLTTYAYNLFKKWHEQDPVSEFEIKKNNAVYKVQGNRNPYIDHPEWVSQIWSS